MNLDEIIEALNNLRTIYGGKSPVLFGEVGHLARVHMVHAPVTMGYSKAGERYIVIE